MTSPNEFSVATAAAAIRDKSLTSRALVDACLARIEARDADVEAWIFLDPALARAQADAADAALAAGKPSGPLHGIPVGLKDIIDTRDMPTENGSAVFTGRRPATDSTIAKLLRDAGAVILGKTVTTEFALSAAGKTKNPHNPAHTPGGSSSGSAAAVADFQVPLAVGTQTGGSMIRPASYCGIYGYKPTFGSISRAGMFPLARPLDHPGTYARSLADLAIISDVLMVVDAADMDMRTAPASDLSHAATAGPAPRIAFVKGPMWQATEPYMDTLFADALAPLGAHVHDVEMTGIFDSALACQETVMMANVSANIGEYVQGMPDKVKAETKRRAKQGGAILATDYVKAIEFRDTLGAAIDRMLEHVDVIVTAAAPGEAPFGLESTGNAIFQKIWTLTGVPTVTLPKLHGPTGLPIGLQIIGRHGRDADLFRHACWIDRML